MNNKARVNRENEPYLPQKLPFAVGPARHGVAHHLGQLRFGLFGFIPVSFGRGRRLESCALRHIRIHGVARNTLRRGHVCVDGEASSSVHPGFFLNVFSQQLLWCAMIRPPHPTGSIRRVRARLSQPL